MRVQAIEKTLAGASAGGSSAAIIAVINDWLDTATVGAGLVVLILTAVWWVFKIKRERAEIRRLEKRDR